MTYRRGKEGGHEEWRKHTLDALEWLGENLSRLLICANPKCKRDTRFFFRQHNNNRYCSEDCSYSSQQQKRLELKKTTPKRFKRSDESRLKMSESAKRRWRNVKKKPGSGTAKHVKKRD
jgi:hypothetical protein